MQQNEDAVSASRPDRLVVGLLATQDLTDGRGPGRGTRAATSPGASALVAGPR